MSKNDEAKNAADLSKARKMAAVLGLEIEKVRKVDSSGWLWSVYDPEKDDYFLGADKPLHLTVWLAGYSVARGGDVAAAVDKLWDAA